MSWKFEPKDFRDLIGEPHLFASLANAKLKEWIEAAPVVYKHEGKIPLRYQGASCWRRNNKWD